jgi:hypothetical protein
MNNIQIENILKLDRFSQKCFLGVFARNNLPKVVSYPSAFIFNTDVKSGKGMHWLSIIFTKDKKCQFFDSLGFPPTFYGLENYIKKRSSSLVFNKHPIQSLNSNYCGLYALLFILVLCRGQSFSNFLGRFHLDTNKNDLIIKKHLIFFK